MQMTAVCGNGLGTRLMMKSSIEKIIEELEVTANVKNIDLSSAKGANSDIFIGTRDIAEQLIAQSVNGKIVSLDNIINKQAMKERVLVALIELGALKPEA